MYGGVSASELGVAGLHRVALPIDLEDFNQRIVLAYTGVTRNPGINNWEVTKAYIDGDRRVHRNFDRIAAIANHMRSALERSDWPEAGRLLREEWLHRRKNVPGITTKLIDKLVAVTRRQRAAGATGDEAGGGERVMLLLA